MSTRLWLVIAGNGVLRVAGGASGVLVGVYLADLVRRGAHLDAAFAGMLAAIAFGAELVGALPFGFAADVVSTRTLMVGSALLAAAAAALFGLSQNVNVLGSSRVLEGLAAAAGVPALLANQRLNLTKEFMARGRLPKPKAGNMERDDEQRRNREDGVVGQ